MLLREKIVHEINSKNLFDHNDKIVVGVSGGIDSITLAALLNALGYDIAIAHCNFSLRGDESDGDSEFVKNFALINSIPYHYIKFDTKKEAEVNSESIQICARRLRYEWFEKLCDKFRYTKIAIGHNSDDTIETFFINIVRGTGIKGLLGIPQKRDKIVRPLLSSSRDEIVAWAALNGLSHREDSTNSHTKYLRNKIRHKITPVFKELNNDFNKTMLSNVDSIGESYALLSYFIQKTKDDITTYNNDTISIDLSRLISTPKPSYTLFEIIRTWGFTYSQSEQIISSYETSRSGLEFFSERYHALLNRNELILRAPENNNTQESSLLNLNDKCLFNGIYYHAELLSRTDIKTLKTLPDTAIFDAETIIFPLKIRLTKDGDRIIPLGMNGYKKVSDIMIDSKLSLYEKEKQSVIESESKLIWLTHLRSSDSHKVTAKTQNIIRITTWEKE